MPRTHRLTNARVLPVNCPRISTARWQPSAASCCWLIGSTLAGQEKEAAKGQAEIIVAKHRNGPTGIVEVIWLPAITRFENKAATWQETAAASGPQRIPDFEPWSQS